MPKEYFLERVNFKFFALILERLLEVGSSEILISIIIPCWNSSKSITKAVHSVTNQLKKNYEIVIIDDASEDDTWQVLKKLNEQYNEIKIIRNKTNKGPSASRNYGIKISRGKFVGFLDSDDYFKSGFQIGRAHV